jgi:hypothetical protein
VIKVIDFCVFFRRKYRQMRELGLTDGWFVVRGSWSGLRAAESLKSDGAEVCVTGEGAAQVRNVIGFWVFVLDKFLRVRELRLTDENGRRAAWGERWVGGSGVRWGGGGMVLQGVGRSLVDDGVE